MKGSIHRGKGDERGHTPGGGMKGSIHRGGGMKGGIHSGDERRITPGDKKGHTPGGMKGGIHWDGMEVHHGTGHRRGGEENNSSSFRIFLYN
jgi:hypothetical protein